MTAHHPPGEPAAERLAEQLADVVVMDGPRAGEVWTFDGSKGGYIRASAAGLMDDETICDDIGALLVHVGAQVVRPASERDRERDE